MAKTEKPSAGKASDKKTKKESAAQAKEPKPEGAAQVKGQDEPKVTPRLKETYRNQIVPALMKEFGYKNPMQVPKVDRVVLNVGMGEAIQNVKLLEGGYPELARMIHGHPTLSEAVMEAARAADGWVIHG